MKIIDEKLKELWASDIVRTTKKDKNIITYTLNWAKKKVVLDWWEVSIKVFRIQESYKPKFIEHKKRIDEACLKLDQEFKPTLEAYQSEIKEATEKELLRQFDIQTKAD